MGNMRKGDLTEVIETVYESLERAQRFQLRVEVVASAMLHLKANPQATVEECFEAAFNEWDV